MSVYGTLQNDKSQRAAIQALLAGTVPLPAGWAGDGSVPRLVAEKLAETVSVKDFGAVGGGVTDDTAAIQAALSSGATSVYVPQGTYRTTDVLVVPSGVTVYGDGPSSRIINDETASGSAHKSVFAVGWWHPAMYGQRPLESEDPFDRRVNRYQTTGAVAKSGRSVTLGSGDGANFAVGDLVYVGSYTVWVQTATGVEIELPLGGTITKITDITTDTLTFETALNFADATGAFVCKPNGEEEDDLPCALVENVVIRDLYLSGNSFAANWGCYRSHAFNIQGDFVHGIWGNGWCHGSIHDFNCTYEQHLIEVKFSTDNLRIYNIHGVYKGSTSGVSIISTGEYCRNVDIEHIRVDAASWAGGSQVLQIQPGLDVSMRNIRVYAPLTPNLLIQVYDDANQPASGILLEDIYIRGGACDMMTLAADDSTDRPADVTMRRVNFVVDTKTSQKMLAANGCGRLTVKDCSARLGTGDSCGDLNIGSLVATYHISDTDVETISGAGVANGVQHGNYKCASGTITAVGSTQVTLSGMTNNTGQSANTVVEVMPTLTDSPASADALRDDIVANLVPAIGRNFSDLTNQMNNVVLRMRAALDAKS